MIYVHIALSRENGAKVQETARFHEDEFRKPLDTVGVWLDELAYPPANGDKVVLTFEVPERDAKIKLPMDAGKLFQRLAQLDGQLSRERDVSWDTTGAMLDAKNAWNVLAGLRGWPTFRMETESDFDLPGKD